MSAEAGQCASHCGAGDAFVHQKREDGFVKRSKVVLRIFVDKNGYLLRSALLKHSSPLSLADTLQYYRSGIDVLYCYS